MIYRIYDKHENKYPDNQHDFFIGNDGKLYKRSVYMRPLTVTRATVTIEEADPSRYIVEKAVGLKDKNGVGIFEGDVVNSEVKMSGIKTAYFCFCTSKKDCPYYVLKPKKERCKGCESCGINPTPDHCHACDNLYPRCKYYENGMCCSSVAIVNKLVLELQRLTGQKVKMEKI